MSATTNRRDVLRYAALASGAALWPGGRRLAAQARGHSLFRLWQLPLHQTSTQGNSYVLCTEHGKVVVIDGGVAGEAGYLRGFLGALGNRVEAWFLSHPHPDHMGALNEVLEKPDGVEIKTIYHSELSPSFYRTVEPDYLATTEEFYGNLKKTEAQVVDVKPGLTVDVDAVKVKVLAAKNEELTENAYNNSCMAIRVSDAVRSFVFLGDMGEEQGEKVLNGPFREELNCDFLQLAHHGQSGVNRKFYQTVKFSAALWPTPAWLWNNDSGNGHNSGPWATLETREWLKEMGIQKHFVGADGLHLIE